MANEALVRNFSAAIERAYSQKTRRVESEYDRAIGIINAVRDVRLLDALAKAYLDLFFKYAAHANTIRYHRSDQTFYELFERCKRISTDKQSLFTEWAAQLDSPAGGRLKRRFEELDPTYKSKIRALAPKPAPKAKLILDYLREEFLKQRGYAPKSNADLYDLDPDKSPTLKEAFQNELASVKGAWDRAVKGDAAPPRTLKGPPGRIILHLTLDNYRTFLADTARQGLPQLFQVLKYLQDMLIGKREKMGAGVRRYDVERSPLTCELYAMACLQLLVVAQGKLVLPSNREMFTPEERAYFLNPMRDSGSEYEYLSNIEHRFSQPLGNVQWAFGLTKTFLDLVLLTHNQISRAKLVPLRKTHEVQKFWADLNALKTKLKTASRSELVSIVADPDNVRLALRLAERLAIEVPLGVGGAELGIAYARVGASPGFHETLGRVTIVDIDPKNTGMFYVEYEALKPNVFVVNAKYIGDKVYGSRIGELARSLAGILYLVAGTFLIMGFMPVFIKAGFAGLIGEILIAFAAGKLEEVADEVHPVFGTMVGLAAESLAPRPGFKPKVVAPPGLGGRPQVKSVAVFEGKGGTAVEGRATRQMDEAWLDRATSKTEVDLRGIAGKADSPAAAPKTRAAEKPVGVPAARRAGAAADESVAGSIPPRPPRFQKLQQQQTQTKAPDTDVPATPTRPAGSARSVPREQKLQPVGVKLDERPGRASASDATAGRNTADRRAGDRRFDDPQGQQLARATGGTATAERNAPAIVIRVGPGWSGQRCQIVGDRAQFEASQRGFHVYEYFDANGRLLYAGRSGSIQEGPNAPRVQLVLVATPEPPLNNWIDRLNADHINTTWISDARSVRLTYDISRAEMLALEEVRIDAHQAAAANWNFRRGDFTREFGGGTEANLHANAESATRSSTATFSIRTSSTRTR